MIQKLFYQIAKWFLILTWGFFSCFHIRHYTYKPTQKKFYSFLYRKNNPDNLCWESKIVIMYFSSYNFLFTETLEKRFVRMEHNGTLADNLTYVFTMWQGWTAKQGDSMYFYFSTSKKSYCNNFNRGNNNKNHIKSSLNRVSLIIQILKLYIF